MTLASRRWLGRSFHWQVEGLDGFLLRSHPMAGAGGCNKGRQSYEIHLAHTQTVLLCFHMHRDWYWSHTFSSNENGNTSLITMVFLIQKSSNFFLGKGTNWLIEPNPESHMLDTKNSTWYFFGTIHGLLFHAGVYIYITLPQHLVKRIQILRSLPKYRIPWNYKPYVALWPLYNLEKSRSFIFESKRTSPIVSSRGGIPKPAKAVD